MSIPIEVSPPTNDLTLSKDQTLAEVVKVTIPKSGVVPKVDAYFLADTTGSMNTAIAAVKSGIVDAMTRIQALGSDVWFGVGDYKDFPAPVASEHPYAFKHQCSLSADITQVKAAIDSWKTSPGQDTPEAQFYGLDQVAEPPGGKIGWRADSKRIIVWFGDAAGHDSVCKAISKLSYDITEASVTAKLVAEKIKVLALSMNTNYRAPAGLDDEPRSASSTFKSKCGEPGGTPGQGTRIAKATGCKLVQGVSVDTIMDTIVTELTAQIAVIGNVSLVASGATAPFVQAIAPTAGYGPLSRDQDHEISFDVSWLGNVAATTGVQVFNGSLDVVADGEVVGGKTVKITVPAIIPPRPPGPYGQIPLIVELYDHFFSKSSIWGADPGRRLLLSQDTADLATPYQMDNTVSSLKIRPGPDFDPNAHYEVSFYRDANYISTQLVLKPGEYQDIHYPPIQFGDVISSVKFNQGLPPVPPITSIPVVAELYSAVNYGGRKLIVFEDVDNLGTYSAYDNLTYSVKVFKGPNYTPGDKIRLYDTFNGSGAYIELEPGEYPDLQKSHTFGYKTSSTRFLTGVGGSEPVTPGSMEYAHIPLIVELYDHFFSKSSIWGADPGRRLLLSQDTADLATPYQMADTVSSLKIRPGPNYDPKANYEVSFYRDANYISTQLVLKPGEYGDIHYPPIQFGDVISSVKFNQGVPPAPPVTNIPVVAELYDGLNYGGRKLIVFEDVDNLGTYSAYDNLTSSVKVFKGPNYTPGDKIRLYDTFNGTGKYIDLAPGEYPDLQQSHTFSNLTSSTRFIKGDGTGSEPVPPGSMEYAHIPLIVELYDHFFSKSSIWGADPGRRVLLSQDTADLGTPYQMADTVSSLKIRPGPNYDPKANYEVSFYRDANYISTQLVLKPGEYGDIHYPPIQFGDVISSVKFNQGMPPATPVTPIPVVAELYSAVNYGGRKLIVFEDVDNLGTYSAYDNLTSSVKVFAGPNYTPGDKIRLYDTFSGSGAYIELEPGEYPDLAKSHTFGYKTSSTRFIKA
ncbi:MAG TPA: hypothetical protein DGO89_01785 [Microcoleaceae bacterium UBA9251]|jgi:Integrin, beta chain.|nr:hypothetical protein [Microcoleaceae cyanobacterium UBA9251]